MLLEQSKLLTMCSPPDRLVHRPYPHQPPLRDWQERALRAWKEQRRGVVSVVTGAGKTRFALEAMSSHCDRASAPGVVLVVVPTVALVDQWHLEIAEYFDCDLDSVCRHSGSARPRDCGSSRFHLATINTARHVTEDLTSDGRSWMLVVDECHRAGSPENRRALVGRWKSTVGLSATPRREYDDFFEAHVEPALGSVIAEYSYLDALRDGVLTPFELVNVHVPMTDHEDDQIRQLNQQIARLANDPTDAERLRRVLRRRATVSQSVQLRVPVAIRLAVERAGNGTLVFHESIVGAERIRSGMAGQGLRVRSYHSNLSDPARLLNLRLFRSRQIDALVTCRALDEGFDVPTASVGIIAASTSSNRQRIQRLGRTLRKAEGKKLSTVYTLYCLETERSRLEREEKLLQGVASVRWQEVRV